MINYFDINMENTGTGFGMFSAGHFAWLAVAAVFIALMMKIYRRSCCRNKIRRIVAIGALTVEFFRAILLIFAGQYSIYTLPLHLCGLSVYIIFADSFFGNERIWQFMYAFSFPGAVFALIFPDWYYFPLFNVMTTCSFEAHILIVCYIFMQICEKKPDIKYCLSNLLIMILLAVPVYIFDKLTNTNYMFLIQPVAPLTAFSFLGKYYLLGYIPIIAVCWSVMYLPFIKKESFSNI